MRSCWRHSTAHGHLGTTFRVYKNKHCRAKLADGKGVGGSDYLTDVVVNQIQTYYEYVIHNNKGKVEAIKKAIQAILYHTITRPPTEELTN